MLNNDKRYYIIDIPLNVPLTNYNTNKIECNILNRVQMELKVIKIIMDRDVFFQQ